MCLFLRLCLPSAIYSIWQSSLNMALLKNSLSFFSVFNWFCEMTPSFYQLHLNFLAVHKCNDGLIFNFSIIILVGWLACIPNLHQFLFLELTISWGHALFPYQALHSVDNSVHSVVIQSGKRVYKPPKHSVHQ